MTRTFYVPGTEETDLKKIIMSLQQMAGALSASRDVLTADREYFVRSDGSDSNNGFSDTAGGAKATWNGLYSYLTSGVDFNGHTVTMKSGTTNTYSAGLDMTSAWTGGGALVIDLNGCSIAETANKGILNTAAQPGLITVKNSAGLGTGGKITSSVGSGIQNSASCAMNIGPGIEIGTCLTFGLIANQNALMALVDTLRVSGATGQGWVAAAFGGVFGTNGSTVQFMNNITYSVETVLALSLSSVDVAGTTFDLNPGGTGPFTVTGKRYDATQNAIINSAGGGAAFIPGTVAGTTASGGQYI